MRSPILPRRLQRSEVLEALPNYMLRQRQNGGVIIYGKTALVLWTRVVSGVLYLAFVLRSTNAQAMEA